ncbi:hypothetical protein ACFPN2_28230 [Steroidobacter flavus]|uniref:Uncharacterized protein n=1 Tax=Steroidobacter flavus TaxID=1842136 RepID=A0ABV8T2Q3_9GAMM
MAASKGDSPYRYTELTPVVEALQSLKQKRDNRAAREESAFIAALRNHVPEVEVLVDLEELTPEQRLQRFDALIHALSKEPGAADNTLRRASLMMLAGYLSTIAAGGAPSLSLTEGIANQWPAVTAWAYVLGGIGERVIWTSAFDGLGRLVARELSRPLHFEDPPTCDFALDEAQVLVDPTLADPLVHLRIKQARVVTVAIFPGVNLSLPLPEPAHADRETKKSESNARQAANRTQGGLESFDEHASALADALWPYLQSRVEEILLSSRSKSRKKDPNPQDQKKLWSRD